MISAYFNDQSCMLFVTIGALVRFHIILLFAFMAQLCKVRNMSDKSKKFYQEINHMT